MAAGFKSVGMAHVAWAVANKDKIANAVREEAPQGGTRQLTLFSSVSGQDATTTLKASIRGRSSGRLGSVSIEVLAGVSYAVIIRDGHGIIVPKKAKVLHWVDENGNDVFAMQTGPVAANPYPARGWKKVSEEVKHDLAKRTANAAVQELLETAKGGGMLTRLGF
jgi:hypothetical protein